MRRSRKSQVGDCVGTMDAATIVRAGSRSRWSLPDRDWIAVSILFLVLIFVFGAGHNTGGIFFLPLLGAFHVGRAHLSALSTALALAMGVTMPVAGWLLDRVEARLIVSVGATLAGCAFLLASVARSFDGLVYVFALMGVGLGLATLVPVATVVTRAFSEQRGLALGFAMSGASFGSMIMTLEGHWLIARDGWRAAYAAFALPIFLIVIPGVWLLVRSHGPSARSTAPPSARLHGMTVREALACRSFWMIAIAQACFAFATAGPLLHLIPYLVGIGYDRGSAAWTLSLMFGLGAIGKLLLGKTADHLGGRKTLALNFTTAALGIALFTEARSLPVLVACVLCYGITVGAPLALVPLVTVESLGLLSFGTVTGLLEVCQTAGAAAGPIAAGWIYDEARSYEVAFVMFAAMLGLGAVATLLCTPLGSRAA